MSAPGDLPASPWRGHALWACLAALYAALIFLLSAVPGSRLDEIGLHPDLANLAHIPLYAGFAGFVLMAFAGDLGGVRRGPWPTLYTIAAVMTYAITDEFHQRFVPGRFSSGGDLARDFLGASIALVSMHLLARRARGAGPGPLSGRAGAASPECLLAVTLAALTFALYLPAVSSGFTNWDDPEHVLQDTAIRSLGPRALLEQATAVRVGHWAPLTVFSYAVDYAVWGGLRPFGFHLTNVLLHALGVALFYLLLRRLGARDPAAWGGAALFAFHPAQVESVAWVTQRRALLSLAFMLLSFLAYVRATAGPGLRRSSFVASLALYAAALLSKVTVMVFPAILLLYDVGYRRERPIRLLAEKAAFVLVTIGPVLGLYLRARNLHVTEPGWIGGSPALHAATMAGLLARYVRILLFPTGLSALYAPPDARSVVSPSAVAGAAFALLGLAGFLWAWRRRRAALVWMGCFWIGFVPFIQIVPYSTRMADRYLQVPLLGFAAAASGLAAVLLREGRPEWRRAAGAVLLFLALLLLASLTMGRERVWHDSVALWTDAVDRPPVAPLARYNFAKSLDQSGDLEGAIRAYGRIPESDPYAVWSLVNLAAIHGRQGHGRQAEATLRRAVTLADGTPEARATANADLGFLLADTGRDAEAIPYFRRAVELDPSFTDARIRLAQSLRRTGALREAALRLDEAMARDPGSAEVRLEQARIDIAQGRLDQALKRLDEVLRRQPLADALVERAKLLARQGDRAAALRDLDRALDETPPGRARIEIQALRVVLRGAPAAKTAGK